MRDSAASVTMARIAESAGVSKALLYAYFENMTALLRAVYQRETQRLNEQHMAALREPHAFEDMVRTTARISRQTHASRQRLIERLAADPLLADVVADEERRNRARVVRFLAKAVTAHFGISGVLARRATRLALRYEPEARLSTRDADALDEIWGAMMVGAMHELERRYGKDTTP